MVQMRTAKTCGPDAAVLASSCPGVHALGADGGKRAVLRGEHVISRKAIAQGMSDCLRCPVCSCAHSSTHCARDLGCSAHPAFPAPSDLRGSENTCIARAHRAARSRSCICRHCEERSDEAIHSFFTWRYGLL